jgi:hypothetical protein
MVGTVRILVTRCVFYSMRIWNVNRFLEKQLALVYNLLVGFGMIFSQNYVPIIVFSRYEEVSQVRCKLSAAN